MVEKLDPKVRAQRMDSEEHSKMLKPHELLNDVIGITKRMTCVDLGCGAGAFSFPMALYADEGMVYAVDNTPEMMERIRSKNPPPNLRLLECDATKTGLEEGIADFCLISLVLHDYKQPDDFISEAFRLLKPGGKLVVVEIKEDVESPQHPKDMLITRERIARLFKKVGFSSFAYADWSERYYIATGIKSKPE